MYCESGMSRCRLKGTLSRAQEPFLDPPNRSRARVIVPRVVLGVVLRVVLGVVPGVVLWEPMESLGMGAWNTFTLT